MKEKNITSKKTLRQSNEILIKTNGYYVGQTKEKATRRRRCEVWLHSTCPRTTDL